MNRQTSWIIFAVMTTACSFGMTAEKFRQTHNPQGIQTRVTTPVVDVVGELLEMRRDGLLLLTSTTRWKSIQAPAGSRDPLVRLIPYGSIQQSSFEQLSGVEITDGRVPSTGDWERLRMVSRFPYGMPPEVLERLLKLYGQTEPAGIKP